MRKTSCIILLLLCTMILGHAASAESIGQIKSFPLGAPVVVSGVVTWIKGFECYVQSEDRIAGIWVQGNTIAIEMGDKVTVAGTLAMDGYELVIAEADIYPAGGAGIIAPFAMSNKAVAGGYAFQQFKVQDRVGYKIPGDGIGYRWDYAGGASNVGMLVKTWGRVEANYYSAESDLSWFLLDDGSQVTADFGDTGIIVYSNAGVKQGDVVSVTGVSGVELALDQPDKLIRTIRPRSTADVEVIKALQTQVGFSDEFNGTEIDPRWAILNGSGNYSTDSGNLMMVLEPESLSPLYYYKMLAQKLPDQFELDMKATLAFSSDPSYTNQGLIVELAVKPNNYAQWTGSRVNALAVISDKTSGKNVFVDYYNNGVRNPLLGNTIWYHMTRRSGVTTARISYDGVEYSEDYHITWLPVLVVYGRALASTPGADPAEKFRVYIDYIRITPVKE